MNDQPRSHRVGGGEWSSRDRAYSSSKDQPLEDPQMFNDAYSQPKREPGVYHRAPYAGPAIPNASHYGHSEQPSSSSYHPVSRPRSPRLPNPSPQQRGYNEPPHGGGHWEGDRSDQVRMCVCVCVFVMCKCLHVLSVTKLTQMFSYLCVSIQGPPTLLLSPGHHIILHHSLNKTTLPATTNTMATE